METQARERIRANDPAHTLAEFGIGLFQRGYDCDISSSILLIPDSDALKPATQADIRDTFPSIEPTASALWAPFMITQLNLALASHRELDTPISIKGNKQRSVSCTS